MLLLFKSLIGVAMVLMAHFASRSNYFFLAGLVPLLPAFAVLTHYMVGQQRQPEELRQTVLFTICSLGPYAAYLITLYFVVDKMSLSNALVCALLVWALCAGILVGLWN